MSKLTLEQELADIVNGAFGWDPPKKIWPELTKISEDLQKFITEKYTRKGL